VLLIVEYCAVDSPVYFILVSLSCFLLFSSGILVPIMMFYCRVVVVLCYLLCCFIVVYLSWGVVIPIILFYCRGVVVESRATYYYYLLSCRVVSCRVVSCLVVLCYLFLSLLFHVVLPIMLVDCRVVYYIIFPARRSRKTTILNCVYLEMRNLGGRGARKSLQCAGSNISKLNHQIFLRRGSLESQE
jgi:hypothetical protein